MEDLGDHMDHYYRYMDNDIMWIFFNYNNNHIIWVCLKIGCVPHLPNGFADTLIPS